MERREGGEEGWTMVGREGVRKAGGEGREGEKEGGEEA